MAKSKYFVQFKFPEPKTFRGATSPLTLIKWALGIGTLEYPASHPRRAISLCWSGITIIFLWYCIGTAALENIWDMDNSTVTRTTYQMYFITFILFSAMFISLGQLNSKNMVDSFCRIDSVNESLNKLGIPKEYGFTFRSQIIHAVGGFLFTTTTLLIPIICNFNTIPTQLIGSCISAEYIIFVSFLEDFTFISCIRYIAKRFRHLNMYLEKLSKKSRNTKPFRQDLDDPNPNPWLSPIAFENHLQSRWTAVSDEQWLMSILRNSRKVHRDLCNVAKILNEVYGIQILISMTTAVAVITIVLFNTYSVFVDFTAITTAIKITILSDLFWIGYNGMKVFWIISACSTASKQAHQTGERIYELVKPGTSNEIREEIHAFSLQLLENPLQFTAYGFFTLDHTLIRAMVGTVTTYLVIMIQVPRTSPRVNNPTLNGTIPAISTTI